MLENEFHINYKREVRKLALHKLGCVCRSLSSIAQAPLTEEQKDFRLTQITEHKNAYRRLINLRFTHEVANSDLRQLSESICNLNISQINNYITSLRNQSNTPVGEQLLRMDISAQNVSREDIRKLYNDGCRIMIIIPGHAMHIEPKGKKKFISLSDGGNYVKLKNKKYKAFIFKLKERSKTL